MKFKDRGVIACDHEHNSRELHFEIEEGLNDCDIYIDFQLPNGTKYKSARLTDLTTYVMPNALLVNSGLIGCQLVAYRGDTFIKKSKVVYYSIDPSINASQDIADNEADAIEELHCCKADNITFANSKLRLMAEGEPIGDEVEIQSGDFTRLTGTSENPIYMKDLQSGNYIVNGVFRPNANASITIHASNQIIEAYRNSNIVYVYMIDRAREIELYEVSTTDDTYTIVDLPINALVLNKLPTNDAMDIFYCLLDNQAKVENSVVQTLMIHLMFPATIPNNYFSKIVFKLATTIPPLTIEGATIRWIGDSVVNNQLVLQANKIYTINFEKDVFDLVGRVEARDY